MTNDRWHSRADHHTVQSEDLGAWVQAQRLGWDQLLPAQAWMLENMLHLTPAEPDERPPAPRTQADKWAPNIGGRPAVPHPRRQPSDDSSQGCRPAHRADGTQTTVKLGLFLDNCRRRADKLSPERRAELDALGMRW